MDHFERELARMMRDSREHTPFEPEHQVRLHAGVRAHRRVRAVRAARLTASTSESRTASTRRSALSVCCAIAWT